MAQSLIPLFWGDKGWRGCYYLNAPVFYWPVKQKAVDGGQLLFLMPSAQRHDLTFSHAQVKHQAITFSFALLCPARSYTEVQEVPLLIKHPPCV